MPQNSGLICELFCSCECLQLEDKRATEHLIKIEEAGTGKRPSKRPDLKAISKVILQGKRACLGSMVWRIVRPPHCFEFRATMPVVGYSDNSASFGSLILWFYNRVQGLATNHISSQKEAVPWVDCCINASQKKGIELIAGL